MAIFEFFENINTIYCGHSIVYEKLPFSCDQNESDH